MNLLKWGSVSSFDYCICIECFKVHKCWGVCLVPILNLSLVLQILIKHSLIFLLHIPQAKVSIYLAPIHQWLQGGISPPCASGKELKHNTGENTLSFILSLRLAFAKPFPAAPCYLQLPTISKLCIFRTLFCMIDFLYIVETRTTLQILYLSFFLSEKMQSLYPIN